MSAYKGKISINADNTFYAYIVRIDRDGQESVVPGFGKHYTNLANAERGIYRFMRKNNLQKAKD